MARNRIWKYRGLFVIVLWQATPVQYGLGYGESRIDEYLFTGGGCAPGSPPAEEFYKKHRPRSFGASVSGWASQKLRLGGAVISTSADTTTLSGLQAKAVIAGEWRWFGIGTGFVVDQAEPVPGVYLRLGQLNTLHFRLDMPDVSMPVSSSGVGRLGVAYNQTAQGGFGAFAGIPICYTTCEYGAEGPRADVRIPVANAFDVTMSGFTHSNDREKFWGIAIGGSIRR
jgi:hypothetical protein